MEQILIELNFESSYVDECVKYATKLKDNNMPIIFDSIHLAKLIGIQVSELYSYHQMKDLIYKEIRIPKKNGKIRTINAPSENLKYIQRWVLDNIISKIPCSENAMGYINDRSIVCNAIMHVNKPCVVNLDISDFFPSIPFKRVYSIFREQGYTKHLSMFLAGICTYKGVLPQGAPTSPYISNLVCRRLDNRLSVLAQKIEASFSRYADDLTFSGEVFITEYLKLIKRVIREENFEINEDKCRIQYRNERQSVTGLIVNDRLSVPISTKKYIRQQIYYSKKFGVKSNLLKQNILKSNYRDHLYGLAYFVRMVEFDEGKLLLAQLDQIDWES